MAANFAKLPEPPVAADKRGRDGSQPLVEWALSRHRSDSQWSVVRPALDAPSRRRLLS